MKKRILPIIILNMMCLTGCTSYGHGHYEATKQSLYLLYPWMKDMNQENLESIYLKTDLGSIAPTLNAFNMTYIASNEEIEEACNYFKNATYLYSDDSLLEPGGIITSYIVNFKSGASYTFSYTNYRFSFANQYYEILERGPSFSTLLGYSFLWQTVYTLKTIKNGEEIDFDKSFFNNILFNEVSEKCTQLDEFKEYMWTLSNVEDNQLKILDATHFSIKYGETKKYYSVLNDNFSFSNYIERGNEQ